MSLVSKTANGGKRPIVSPKLVSGKVRNLREESEALLGLIHAKLGDQIKSAKVNLEQAEIEIEAHRLLDIFNLLKIDSELHFDFFVNVTCVDWLDAKPQRFELVYHLLSIVHAHRLRVKVLLDEDRAEVDSAVSLWAGANFMEREVWDMFGVKFRGHPDLRRILMYDEFVGHPLRKDYPVQGKQPRIPLRHPEVTNTAVLMQRSDLVRINPKNGKAE